MHIEHDIPMADLTTLRVGGRAHEVVTIESRDDIPEAVRSARQRGMEWSVVGGGSNILASDDTIGRCILLMRSRGVDIVEDDGERVVVSVAAGESWDGFIDWAASHDLWGVENLAGIPGTVGATPVQNVGAYGAEIGDILVSVEAFDPDTMSFVVIAHDACAFGYRNSVFKHPEGERFIISSVVMRLTKRGVPNISYKDLAERFMGADSATLTPTAIADMVRSIRSAKFPDLTVVGTAGSFFKNPVVSSEYFGTLRARFPDLPGHESGVEVKLSLAWILDHVCGLKGYRAGFVALFERQPLVLVAYDGATAREIDAFARDIATRVHDAIGIEIEREVRTLS